MTAPNHNKLVQVPATEIISVFGARMRKERKKQGLSQKQLAEISGVSEDTIKRYETGRANSGRLDVAFYIAKALDVSLDELLPGRPSNPETILKDQKVQSVLMNLIGLLKKQY